MKKINRSVIDVFIATTFVVIICTLMLLQGMIAGFSRSSMIYTENKINFGIICSFSQSNKISTQPEDDTSPSPDNCPCTSLCRLSTHILFFIIASAANYCLVPIFFWKNFYYFIKKIQHSSLHTSKNKARAPPSNS